jgi:hypothetical protein
MKQLGILTNIDANHGSCIFNISLFDLLRELIPAYKIRFLDYLPLSWTLYEGLRALKLNKKIPLYNFHRYTLLNTFSRKNLPTEPLFSTGIKDYEFCVSQMIRKDFNALVVGKVVWDIARIWQTPEFPNVYYLSERIPAVKIAYAVSGHRTDPALFAVHKDQVTRILSSYRLIGVRDDLTEQMMTDAGVDRQVKVLKVPDPAFFYKTRPTRVRQLFAANSINPDRPIMGLLAFGKPQLSKAIVDYFHARGYQVINFSMFNPFVDVNLGHIVNPYEWADLFRELDFCITDRFHCAIFCLKNLTPFMAIEPYQPRSPLNSKVFNLLKDFGCTDLYRNTMAPDFNLNEFCDTCVQINLDWELSYKPIIKQKLDETAARGDLFHALIKEIL